MTCNCQDPPKKKYIQVTIPYCKCTPDGPKIETSKISVEQGTYTDEVKKLYEDSANLAALGCINQGRIVIPESWSSRVSDSRPVLAILYREKSASWGEFYTTIKIPHYDKPQNYKPNFPKFQKGSFFSTAHLSDGSKIVVNTNSAAEGKRVLNALLQHSSLKANAQITSGERKDQGNVKQIQLVPIRCDFYPDGWHKGAGRVEWSLDLSGYAKQKT
jgi:hypothetical protein